VEAIEGLRLTGGVRGDYYHYDVRGKDAEALVAGRRPRA